MGKIWENIWLEDDKPLFFETKAQAQSEIDDLLALMPDYSPEDYRIVRLEDVLRALLDDDNEETRAAAKRALAC
jgi:hypothetical protein